MIKEKNFNFKPRFTFDKRLTWLDNMFEDVRSLCRIDLRNNYIVYLFFVSVGDIEGLNIIRITNELFKVEK